MLLEGDYVQAVGSEAALLLLSGMVVKLTKAHFPGKGAIRKTGE